MTNDELLAGGLEKVAQAAKRLGVNKNTIYHWIQDGRIPYWCINTVYRIPTCAVDELLAQALHPGSFQESEQH